MYEYRLNSFWSNGAWTFSLPFLRTDIFFLTILILQPYFFTAMEGILVSTFYFVQYMTIIYIHNAVKPFLCHDSFFPLTCRTYVAYQSFPEQSNKIIHWNIYFVKCVTYNIYNIHCCSFTHRQVWRRDLIPTSLSLSLSLSLSSSYLPTWPDMSSALLPL